MSGGTATSTALEPAPGGSHDRRLLELAGALKSSAVRVISTDVFDTLVWRQVPEPVDAFPIVGERLLDRGGLSPSLSPDAFARLRRIAEERARHNRHAAAGDTEVRLEEVYALLPDWVFGPSPDRTAALEAELEVETELVVPDLDVVALLHAAQEAGKTIVAVSDTYLSEPQLRRLLTQPVLGEVAFDRVFTSSDHRTNKSGGLFEIVLRALGAEPGEVLHLGDNRQADVESPDELGIRGFHFERVPEPFGSVAAAERRFMPARADSTPAGALVSGLTASRSKVLSRIEAGTLPPGLRPYWDYGAVVLGPVFTGFAEWVQDHCARTGTRRVACLMREGAFLGQLLRNSNAYLGGSLDAFPAWVNRDLCLRASIVEGAPHEYELLLARRSALTVAEGCRLLGVSVSSLPDWAGHADTSLEDPVVRANVFEALSEGSVRDDIVGRSRALRERLVAYVEHLCAGDPRLTLVDLGWGASIQGLLIRLLEQAGEYRHLTGLYLVTHEGAANQVMRGAEVHGFLGDFGFPDELTELVMRSPELLEQICMPPHGTQLDLGADFEPVLAGNDLPRLQLAEADAVRKGILAYQREWARYQVVLPGRIPSLVAARPLLRPILLRSVVAPTGQEVAHFGGWHHDEGQGSGRTDEIADRASVERLRHMGAEQARQLPMQDLYWPFGLAAQVDEHWPALMAAAAAGQIEWDALDAPLETGAFKVRAKGVDTGDAPAVSVVPTRNRHGLSAVTGSVRAPHVQELSIELSERPGIFRVDWIELRIHQQGSAAPLVVRFDTPEQLGRWQAANLFRVPPNVFIAHSGGGSVSIALAELTRRIVFRVDVECAFAAMTAPYLLPAGGRFRDLDEAAQNLANLESSQSWRLTAPLRAVKRRLR